MDLVMKYIVVEVVNGGPAPILFPVFIQHVHMALDVGFPVRSAGWVKVKNGDVITYGDSISPNTEPHPDDAKLIRSYLMVD